METLSPLLTEYLLEKERQGQLKLSATKPTVSVVSQDSTPLTLEEAVNEFSKTWRIMAAALPIAAIFAAGGIAFESSELKGLAILTPPLGMMYALVRGFKLTGGFVENVVEPAIRTMSLFKPSYDVYSSEGVKK